MIRPKLSKTTVLAALFLTAVTTGLGTASGAEDLHYTVSTVQQAASTSPEAHAANVRVDRARDNFEQARKQLSAAKAVLKAADAEYKAAKADRDALALRTTAQQLADASGLAATTLSDSGHQIIVPPNGNRLTPVPTAATPVPIAAPMSAAPAASMDFNGTAAPQDDLKPNPAASPTIVP